MIVKSGFGAGIIFWEILPAITLLAIYDSLVVIGFQIFHQQWMEQPALPISLLGSALALFLGMRNNVAYGRWWEGRSLWGTLTNNCRSFGREAGSLYPDERFLLDGIIAYPCLLAASLAGAPLPEEVLAKFPFELQEALKTSDNPANHILYVLGREIVEAGRNYGTDGALTAHLDRTLCDLANSQGGLERIKRTPIPVQYSMLPSMATHLFCLVLPLSAVQTLGWITPLGSGVIGIIFQMLDRCGRDLQDPFESGPHALPMRAMARTIEINLLQDRGLPAPKPVTPRYGVLA